MPAKIKRREAAKGKAKWQVNVRGWDPVKGEEIRVYRTFATRAEAQRFVRDREVAVERGGVVDPSRELLKDFLELWLSTTVADQVRSNTARQYRYSMEKYVNPYLGGIPLCALTLDHIAVWQATLRQSGLSRRTRQLALVVLRQALRVAVEGQKIAYNPADSYRIGRNESSPRTSNPTTRVVRGMEIPDAPTVQSRHLSSRRAIPPEDAAKFMQAAKGSQYEFLFTLLLTLGLRPSEALALRWSDIDGRQLRVERSVQYLEKGRFEFLPTKTKTPRMVPLTDHLLKMLSQQKARVGKLRMKAGSLWQDLDLVFPHPEGKPLRWDVIRRRHWIRVLKRAGLGTTEVDPETGKVKTFHPAFAPYSTRHTAVSNMARAGVNVKVAAAVVGHSDTSTTLRWYTHSATELEAEAVAAGADFLQGGKRGAKAKQKPPSADTEGV